MAHHDFPASAFPDHPVPGILTFTGQDDLRISVLRFGIDETAVDDVAQRRWWADLAFHPFGPPAQDAECTLHFGGTIGRGRIAAGSTRMLGEGPPPTIRMAYVEDEGDPEMTARPEPKPNAQWERLAIREPNGDITYTWPNVPPQANLVTGARVLGWPDMAAVAQDLATLRDMTANLQQHIDERAHELAAPRITDVEERAAEQLAVAREEAGQPSVFIAECIWFSENPVDGRKRIAVAASLDAALGALGSHDIFGGDLVATEITGAALGTKGARTWAVHERGEEPNDEGCLWITEEPVNSTDQTEGTPA